MYRKYLKRWVDVVVSFFMLILLSPLLLIFTICLFVANNGKPFFLQERPGRNNRIFKIVKFKTMNDRKDASGNLLPDELRLTLVGKFVRKTSVDELPQLINVLKGDMSLIGPRPLLVQYLPLYSEQQKRRHEVRPGITGWAQVNGRNAISWEQKFKLDVWYVDNISYSLDVKIVFLTLSKVIKKENINSSSSATMEEFTG